MTPYRRKKFHHISLTAAMADMALLLLVFFMTATSMIPQKTEQIDLPKANAEMIDQNQIFISITKDAEIILNNEKVTLEELAFKLSEDQEAIDKKIVILADRSLSYGAVSNVLRISRSLELLNVVFLSQTEE